MNESDLLANWVAGRCERAPAPDADFSADVMARVREAAAVPSYADRLGVAVRKRVPARSDRVVYLGGGALAGVLRSIVILYLVLGAS